MAAELDKDKDGGFESSSSKPDPASYGLQKIDVSLDNTDRVFLAGKSVTGKVMLDLAAPISALGIRVRCKGEARVYFTDRSAMGIRRRFGAEEAYVHLKPYIIGDGATPTQISSDSYEFNIKLPEEIPCSFEGRYGRIRYSIRASLVIDNEVVFHSSVVPFSVTSTCDLNEDSLAPLPISEKQSKSYVGQRGPVNLELSLPVRGFVPGQTVPLQIFLSNESNVRVFKIRIVLKKVVTYRAKEKSRRHKEIVIEIEQALSGNEENISDQFDVPSVPPSGMKCCKIIDVRYALKVEARVDLGDWYYRMLQKNPKIRTNIVIGTVPLKNYEDTLAEADGDLRLGSKEEYEKSQIYRSSKPDKDDPTGDEGDSDGEVSPYSPMYRVYKFKESSAK
ncbi:hypothetical protein QAD02_001235 [Eretmocerus hayati]|uniref:Uncharacterized protein n=1 Tax=Eretmocerus hayati TaxID=131215 RepID=A0ACC2NGD8_9HYME|nr:hypothetical protein QAD02_001235 [Eretmocerus hayati]